MKTSFNSKSGFTLIEVIAVLVLLGILAAVAVPKYIDITEAAANRAVDAAVAELNGREAITWAETKLEGETDPWTDALPADTGLGDSYTWADGDPTTTGGDITFDGGTAITLSRAASTTTSPAIWTRP